MDTLSILIRGLLLRCPYCGEGKLFRRFFSMYEKCPVCGWRYEREEGYWTGAMAVNLTVTVLLMVAILLSIAVTLASTHIQVPLLPLMLVSVPIPILLPLLLFRHSKSLWMSIDFLLHPVEPDEHRSLPPRSW